MAGLGARLDRLAWGRMGQAMSPGRFLVYTVPAVLSSAQRREGRVSVPGVSVLMKAYVPERAGLDPRSSWLKNR